MNSAVMMDSLINNVDSNVSANEILHFTNENKKNSIMNSAKTKIFKPKLIVNGNSSKQHSSMYVSALREALFTHFEKPYKAPDVPSSLLLESDQTHKFICRQCKDCFHHSRSLQDHISRGSWILGYWCRHCFQECEHLAGKKLYCSKCIKLQIQKYKALQTRGLTKNDEPGIVKIFFNPCQLLEHMQMHNSEEISIHQLMLLPFPSGIGKEYFPHLKMISEALMDFMFLSNIHIIDWLLKNKIHKWWRMAKGNNPVANIIKKYPFEVQQIKQLLNCNNKVNQINKSNDSSSTTCQNKTNKVNNSENSLNINDSVPKKLITNAETSNKLRSDTHTNPQSPADITFVDCGPCDNVNNSTKEAAVTISKNRTTSNSETCLLKDTRKNNTSIGPSKAKIFVKKFAKVPSSPSKDKDLEKSNVSDGFKKSNSDASDSGIVTIRTSKPVNLTSLIKNYPQLAQKVANKKIVFIRKKDTLNDLDESKEKNDKQTLQNDKVQNNNILGGEKSQKNKNSKLLRIHNSIGYKINQLKSTNQVPLMNSKKFKTKQLVKKPIFKADNIKAYLAQFKNNTTNKISSPASVTDIASSILGKNIKKVAKNKPALDEKNVSFLATMKITSKKILEQLFGEDELMYLTVIKTDKFSKSLLSVANDKEDPIVNDVLIYRKKMLSYLKNMNKAKVYQRISHVKAVSRKYSEKVGVLNDEFIKGHQKLSSLLEDIANNLDSALQYIGDDYFGPLLDPISGKTCKTCNKCTKPSEYLIGFSHVVADLDYCLCYDFICYKCNTFQGNKERFQSHLKFHNCENPPICPECNINFSSMENLNIHIWTECFHPLVRRFLSCEICEINGFCSLEAIMNHFVIMHSFKMAACNLCCMVFEYKRYCVSHMKKGHSEPTDAENPLQLIFCQLDNRVMPVECYTHHMKVHECVQESIFYCCEFCTNKKNIFKTRESIKAHIYERHYSELSNVIDKEALNKILLMDDIKKLIGTNLNTNKLETIPKIMNATEELKITETFTITDEIFKPLEKDILSLTEEIELNNEELNNKKLNNSNSVKMNKRKEVDKKSTDLIQDLIVINNDHEYSNLRYLREPKTACKTSKSENLLKQGENLSNERFNQERDDVLLHGDSNIKLDDVSNKNIDNNISSKKLMKNIVDNIEEVIEDKNISNNSAEKTEDNSILSENEVETVFPEKDKSSQDYTEGLLFDDSDMYNNLALKESSSMYDKDSEEIICEPVNECNSFIMQSEIHENIIFPTTTTSNQSNSFKTTTSCITDDSNHFVLEKSSNEAETVTESNIDNDNSSFDLKQNEKQIKHFVENENSSSISTLKLVDNTNLNEKIITKVVKHDKFIIKNLSNSSEKNIIPEIMNNNSFNDAEINQLKNIETKHNDISLNTEGNDINVSNHQVIFTNRDNEKELDTQVEFSIEDMPIDIEENVTLTENGTLEHHKQNVELQMPLKEKEENVEEISIESIESSSKNFNLSENKDSNLFTIEQNNTVEKIMKQVKSADAVEIDKSIASCIINAKFEQTLNLINDKLNSCKDNEINIKTLLQSNNEKHTINITNKISDKNIKENFEERHFYNEYKNSKQCEKVVLQNSILKLENNLEKRTKNSDLKGLSIETKAIDSEIKEKIVLNEANDKTENDNKNTMHLPSSVDNHITITLNDKELPIINLNNITNNYLNIHESVNENLNMHTNLNEVSLAKINTFDNNIPKECVISKENIIIDDNVKQLTAEISDKSSFESSSQLNTSDVNCKIKNNSNINVKETIEQLTTIINDELTTVNNSSDDNKNAEESVTEVTDKLSDKNKNQLIFQAKSKLYKDNCKTRKISSNYNRLTPQKRIKHTSVLANDTSVNTNSILNIKESIKELVSDDLNSEKNLAQLIVENKAMLPLVKNVKIKIRETDVSNNTIVNENNIVNADNSLEQFGCGNIDNTENKINQENLESSNEFSLHLSTEESIATSNNASMIGDLETEDITMINCDKKVEFLMTDITLNSEREIENKLVEKSNITCDIQKDTSQTVTEISDTINVKNSSISKNTECIEQSTFKINAALLSEQYKKESEIILNIQSNKKDSENLKMDINDLKQCIVLSTVEEDKALKSKNNKNLSINDETDNEKIIKESVMKENTILSNNKITKQTETKEISNKECENKNGKNLTNPLSNTNNEEKTKIVEPVNNKIINDSSLKINKMNKLNKITGDKNLIEIENKEKNIILKNNDKNVPVSTLHQFEKSFYTEMITDQKLKQRDNIELNKKDKGVIIENISSQEEKINLLQVSVCKEENKSTISSTKNDMKNILQSTGEIKVKSDELISKNVVYPLDSNLKIELKKIEFDSKTKYFSSKNEQEISEIKSFLVESNKLQDRFESVKFHIENEKSNEFQNKFVSISGESNDLLSEEKEKNDLLLSTSNVSCNNYKLKNLSLTDDEKITLSKTKISQTNILNSDSSLVNDVKQLRTRTVNRLDTSNSEFIKTKRKGITKLNINKSKDEIKTTLKKSKIEVKKTDVILPKQKLLRKQNESSLNVIAKSKLRKMESKDDIKQENKNLEIDTHNISLEDKTSFKRNLKRNRSYPSEENINSNNQKIKVKESLLSEMPTLKLIKRPTRHSPISFSNLPEKAPKLKAVKKYKIGFYSSIDLITKIYKFKCHLCGDVINTSWSVVSDHYNRNHAHNYELCTVSPKLTRLPDDVVNDINQRKKDKKRKSTEIPSVNMKKKKRWSPKKVNEKTVTSSDRSSGLFVQLESVVDGEGHFKCKKCDKRCIDMIELRQHIVDNHRIAKKNLICLECGENFVVSPSLQMHLKAFHGIDDPLSYMNQNPAYAPDIADFEAEVKTVANQCHVCMAVFKDKAAVDKHLRVHGMAFLNRKRMEARNAQMTPNKKEKQDKDLTSLNTSKETRSNQETQKNKNLNSDKQNNVMSSR